MKIELDLDLDGYLRNGPDGPATIEEVIIGEASRLLLDRIFGDPFTGTVSRRVSQITDEQIRTRVVPRIEEALAAPIQPTGDGFSRSRKDGTVIQRFIEGEVKRQVDAELREALDAAKAEVSVAVRERASELLTKTIAAVAGVRL